MSAEPEETIPEDVPVRLSDDQPVRDYVPRDFVAHGTPIPSDRAELLEGLNLNATQTPTATMPATEDVVQQLGAFAASPPRYSVVLSSKQSAHGGTDPHREAVDVMRHVCRLIDRPARLLTAVDRALLSAGAHFLRDLAVEIDRSLTNIGRKPALTPKGHGAARKKVSSSKRLKQQR